MSTDKQTQENLWLAEFDAALSAHIGSDTDRDARIRQAVIRRLHRNRNLRIFIPLCAFLTAALIAGPQLWRLLTGITAWIPEKTILPQFSVESILSSVAQVPLYAWLSAALLIVILETGLRER